ncbi:MAG: type II secretion system GspH family protein [Endomicrobia bacterium]|nr:type II secretion system GspH family protein [Endomicrobiia bacterium]
MLKNKRGFTSVEIMIVLVISAILLIVFAISRKSQIKAAYLREADILITDIVNKQKIAYFSRNLSSYENIPSTSYHLVGGLEVVDARKYLYFQNFEVVDATTATFVMNIYGKPGTEAAGVTVSMKYDSDGQLVPILNP